LIASPAAARQSVRRTDWMLDVGNRALPFFV
jgi:hypothetical protein